ncbi:MAG: hypothetical protein KatS3mg105_2397 [Gemmatales bacterium]|nr:MAG: hypothetical protein KatS3mg105_2397 [Gemmatales bacterium]
MTRMVRKTVHLGCVDCHGGNPNGLTIEDAHEHPRFPAAWPSSANPVRSYTLLNHEAPEYIRFVNPGDLRVAHLSCGTANCHPQEVLQNRKSMMTHGCMLWGAALYNNGAVPNKWARYGEAYSMYGVPLRLQTVPPPTKEEIEKKGILPFLDPLPRFEIVQPGNILRIFERGGKVRLETGIPAINEEPGRPLLTRLSNRGLGTENRTDPVFVSLSKTRLLDPTLNFLGTNDHAGDYRSSGCTACHMIYANDRSPVNSGPYAKYGNRGLSFNPDPTIPKDEPGHPIEHRFTKSIPTSQCIVCHVHPGTTVMNSYTGFLWWDQETDGDLFYPKKQRYPSSQEFIQAQMSNPNEAAAKGLWSDPEFLHRVYTDLNPLARHTQFADFHGHGWVFRAIFKRDRHGNFLDHNNNVIPYVGNEQLRAAMDPKLRGQDGIPVHLMDIHLEKGMHCIDCHFIQDCHGNTKLYGETRAAIEIQCNDCHGTVTQRANLITSGPARPEPTPDNPKGGRNLAALRTPFGERRFFWRGNKLFQRSMVEKDLVWPVPQVVDIIDPTNREQYNAKAALAKTVRKEFNDQGQMVWGALPPNDDSVCAHQNKRMSCIACHSSWNPSCFGCHLPQKADKKMPYLHFEGDVTKNYVAYNFQTLRNDVYMLGHDGNVTGNRIGPVRSACAIHVGSYNQNRESIYFQQQTISAEGLSGIAFSSNVPHTVRGKNETKNCTDCHISARDDNNAIMAQLLMHGTNYVNFIGMYTWIAAGQEGVVAAVVTERTEPQAVIGSYLHRLAFPDDYAKHLHNKRMLQFAHEHPGNDVSDLLFHPLRKTEVLSIQHRGEYLYTACGEGGLRVFDISMLDHKGFAERIFTAPVSPIGQRFYVPTRYATAVAAPTTIAPDPTRKHFEENHENPVHPLYAFLYVTDKYEGLILVGAGTLLDGNPMNNFLKRDLTFNPGGILCGARAITIIGVNAYICADAGLVVVNLDNPKEPKVTAVLGPEQHIVKPRAVAAQFRYAYVCDEEGIKVLDITDLDHPIPISKLPMREAHNIYLARTYAYVAAGSQGLVILDIENAEKPKVDQIYNAGGCINDCRDVKLGITYVSEFAYLADGKNGLRVVQLTSPETPGNYGFSPRPTPQLIATYKLPKGGHALAISKGVDRDRAVDESGNQIAVFGRVGARPMDLETQRRLYLRNGRVWKVTDDPYDSLYVPTDPVYIRQKQPQRPSAR